MFRERERITDPRHNLIFGVPFSANSFGEILSYMDRYICEKKTGYHISVINLESTSYGERMRSHLEYIKDSVYSCCDSVSIVIISRLLKRPISRLYGPDLMLKCSEYGVERKWRHFFLGGEEGVPELISKRLSEKFPGLIIAGTYSPPFRPLSEAEDEALTQQINASEPDIIWVGLGVPKQEIWIANHKNKINAPWFIGVGAAFNFHAGITKRAPLFVRQVGLEWLYRLMREPRRLIWRNIRTYLFLFRMFFRRLQKGKWLP